MLLNLLSTCYQVDLKLEKACIRCHEETGCSSAGAGLVLGGVGKSAG